MLGRQVAPRGDGVSLFIQRLRGFSHLDGLVEQNKKPPSKANRVRSSISHITHGHGFEVSWQMFFPSCFKLLDMLGPPPPPHLLQTKTGSHRSSVSGSQQLLTVSRITQREPVLPCFSIPELHNSSSLKWCICHRAISVTEVRETENRTVPVKREGDSSFLNAPYWCLTQALWNVKKTLSASFIFSKQKRSLYVCRLRNVRKDSNNLISDTLFTIFKAPN